MPRLTQTLGPWLAPPEGKYAAKLARHKELMTAVFAQLPAHDLFSQNFHHSITNWLPLHWQGFTQTTRYTYVIDELDDVDKVWAGFEAEARRDIRRAGQQLSVRCDLDIERFLDLNELTFKRQGKRLPYTRELVRRLDAACAERGLRRMFFADDAEGRMHAAVYIVWDQDSAYYLMGAADPELRNSGATSLLLWEAIQFAATVTRSFDFEGSMVESIERFFRAFGAKQKPYFHISKMSPRMAVLRGFGNTFGAVRKVIRGR
jgi:lipid II:glycine glycyltransferase (peptidoglycan interpeptide bridge formation enzyme)